jgi:hypothetical protein
MASGTLVGHALDMADGNVYITPYSGLENAIPVGIITHDVKEGDILKYDSTKNTKDILIRVDFSDKF